jgi:hypothetical protein
MLGHRTLLRIHEGLQYWGFNILAHPQERARSAKHLSNRTFPRLETAFSFVEQPLKSLARPGVPASLSRVHVIKAIPEAGQAARQTVRRKNLKLPPDHREPRRAKECTTTGQLVQTSGIHHVFLKNVQRKPVPCGAGQGAAARLPCPGKTRDGSHKSLIS